MSPIQAYTCALSRHPSVSSKAVRAVEARLLRAPDGMLTLTYSVEGDVSRICLPPPAPRRRADDLWRHTCFEAFVALEPGPGYLELNFSPSGQWASYAFSAYRTAVASPETIDAPTIAVTRGEDWVTITAAVCLARLRGGAAAKIALAAVVEETSGELSYWALEHPPGKPDFHDPQGFVLQI